MMGTRVNSSNIAFADYDPGSQRLEITFHNGRKYAYIDVPEDTYVLLLSADSRGRYFHQHIRDNYSCRRIR